MRSLRSGLDDEGCEEAPCRRPDAPPTDEEKGCAQERDVGARARLVERWRWPRRIRRTTLRPVELEGDRDRGRRSCPTRAAVPGLSWTSKGLMCTFCNFAAMVAASSDFTSRFILGAMPRCFAAADLRARLLPICHWRPHRYNDSC